MQNLRFDGRVAIVTGAGRGMGRAHALLLSSRGARLLVNDIGVQMGGEGTSPGPAEEVAAEIRAAGCEAVANTSDVSTEDGAKAAIQAAIDIFGRVDILVHNAGIVTFIPFADMTYKQYRDLVSVHQDGAFLLAKAAWPHMLTQNYGRLIFISSLANMPTLAHYAAAKMSHMGFVRSLAAEGAPNNIRSNALGVIAFTRLMEGYFHRDSGHYDMGLFGQEEMERWWRDNLRPEQVSQVIGWLAHESCDISGETLNTGGGHVSRQFVGLNEGYANARLTPELVAAHRDAIMAVGDDFHVFTPEMDGWQFQRIVSGGAPALPEIRRHERDPDQT